ncbi:MAG: translation initiation factor IF-2, partial [Planctomycetes bacterium]|nr:translation initiation factor IF-2 [Planctomycetota bacterium]
SEVLSGAARGRGRGVRGKSAERERGQVRPRSPRRHGGQSDVGERIKEWRDQDLIERKERLASATGHGLRERRAAERRRRTTAPGGAGETTRRAHVEITTPIVLRDFCAAVGTPFNFVVARLIEHTGAARAINQTIDGDMAELLALDLGITLTVNRAQTALEKLRGEYERRERGSLQPRPPVVAMLGHVDHGKTSLLDAIRATHVARGEAGGITQHIGAYRVDRDGRSVTFLDTPGHEAFTAMRARGANLTDVVVLVVAADDGVMPQTIEAINHAKAANVQIVVALNKIDRPGVDLNRVYAQLAEQGLAPGEWGGETDVIKTSATTGAGIDELLEHLSTLSELLDLKADPTIPTLATVIEAQMREGQGVVAQVLVREGTLTQGDIIVCGPGAGRVRMVRDSSGKRVKEALPGTPVELSGLDELPQAGDSLYEVRDLPQAKQIAGEVREQRREEALAAVRRPARTLEELLAVGDGSEIPELQIIIKADVHGSVDALRTKLEEFPADKARLNVLHAGVGAISEADVRLAQASQAIIIGFHVVADDHARQLAEQVGVEVRQYRVIYEVIEDMHKALAGLLAPLEQEEVRASIEVRQVFRLSRSGAVAGCFVNNGTVARSHKIRLIRDGRIIRAGSDIASLRRFKEDVREVRAGFECGVKIEGFDDVKPGDVMESYEVIEVAQEL